VTWERSIETTQRLLSLETACLEIVHSVGLQLKIFTLPKPSVLCSHGQRKFSKTYWTDIIQTNTLKQQNYMVMHRQRWATATLPIAPLPLSLFAESNSGATLPVTEQK